MPDTHKTVLTRANEAISRGDHEAFLAFCTEDTEWNFVGDRTLRGKDAVRRYMADAYREPPVFRVERMIAEGDFLTAIGEITLKDEDGKATDYAYCDVWRFRDGRMAELRAFVIETGRPS
jgi:ketosteroid isomerase-like protein